MRPSHFSRCVLVGCALFAASALGACDSSGSKPAATTKPKAAATAKKTADKTVPVKATAKPTSTAKAADGKVTPEKAAEQLMPLIKKVAAIVNKNEKNCKKMGEELTAFVKESGEKMKKLYGEGGAKVSVDSALEKKFEKEHDKATGAILEKGEVGCSKEKAVTKALETLGLS